MISIVWDRIRPDPAQPRRVLPEVIRAEFLAGHISARQALERWEALVAEEASRLGRPRPDWRALLDRAPDDRGEDIALDAPGQPGPEEDALRAIVATAATIRHGGQVSPITVSEVESGSHFRIETGERRYWAHHWLNTWLGDGPRFVHHLPQPALAPGGGEHQPRRTLRDGMARQLALLLDLYDIHRRKMSGPDDGTGHQPSRATGRSRRLRGAGRHRAAQFSRIHHCCACPTVWELENRHDWKKRLRPVLRWTTKGCNCNSCA